jgi:hypothetical protein
MFRTLANEMADLYEKKNAAYGNSFGRSVEKYGIIAGLTRLSDKFNRAENLILGAKNDVADEGLADTLMDMASYSIMLLMELPKAKR